MQSHFLLWLFTHCARLCPQTVKDKLRAAASTCNALRYLMESRSQTLMPVIMTNAFNSRGLGTVICELVGDIKKHRYIHMHKGERMLCKEALQCLVSE